MRGGGVWAGDDGWEEDNGWTTAAALSLSLCTHAGIGLPESTSSFFYVTGAGNGTIVAVSSRSLLLAIMVRSPVSLFSPLSIG